MMRKALDGLGSFFKGAAYLRALGSRKSGTFQDQCSFLGQYCIFQDKVTSAGANIFFSGWHENFFAGSTGFSGSAQFMCFTPTIL